MQGTGCGRERKFRIIENRDEWGGGGGVTEGQYFPCHTPSFSNMQDSEPEYAGKANPSQNGRVQYSSKHLFVKMLTS